jgi:hypothetical protein
VTAGAAVAALAAILVVALIGQSGIDRHLEGDGPLASSGFGPARSGESFFANDPGPWTMGYSLCLLQGRDPAIIERVTPATVVGGGLRALGALVREFPNNPYDLGIISAPGYPPALPDKLHPAVGFAVTHACVSTGVPPIDTELLVGIAKPPGSAGGGWDGINVAYRIGSRQYVVTLNNFVFTCGPRTPAWLHCQGTLPSQTPSMLGRRAA